MLDPAFEARMAEIDVELRNFSEEMQSLGTCLRAGEIYVIDARIKFEAVQARRQSILADFARLRADVRRAQP